MMKATNFSNFLTGKSLLYLRIIANLSNRKSAKGYPVNLSSGSFVGGFTLLEVMIVVFMIGILSAIAAPSWDAFTTKQRVKSVNNQVLRALMSAESEAKLRKTPITVQFKAFNINNSNPKLSEPDRIEIILGAGTTQSSPPLKTIRLNGEGEIKLGMITMSVKAGSTNPPANVTLPASLIFDYDGSLAQPPVVTASQTTPFIITIASKAGGTKECVRVETILGAMSTDSDTGCP